MICWLRFRNHTTDLFEKHGFTNVGYWVTRPDEKPSFADKMLAVNQGKESLLYIVSFPDMESRNSFLGSVCKGSGVDQSIRRKPRERGSCA